ncbi:hypothetical protein HMPREF1985_01584 [Mitsuokella sp. oral taxon 131 str. W9106]|nr:hypothetical protein HMPREF1985_01584 [Mitsuokella sp. oral taxon 131 str. W9106]
MKHGAAARRCWIHAAAFLRGDYFCVGLTDLCYTEPNVFQTFVW